MRRAGQMCAVRGGRRAVAGFEGRIGRGQGQGFATRNGWGRHEGGEGEGFSEWLWINFA